MRKKKKKGQLDWKTYDSIFVPKLNHEIHFYFFQGHTLTHTDFNSKLIQ